MTTGVVYLGVIICLGFVSLGISLNRIASAIESKKFPDVVVKQKI